jgi:hypothetical protein
MAEAEGVKQNKGLAVGKVQKVDFKNYLPVTTYNNNLSEPIKYGKSNRYFNELVDVIHQSAVARRCASKIATFIVGNTKTQGIITAKLLQELALQIAVFETVCFRVVYSAEPFIIQKIEAVPVELVRKNGEGDFVYNPRLQNNYSKKYDQELYGFENHTEKERYDLTLAMIANDKNYGFLYYAYMPAVGAYEYSTPTWASSMDIVSADGLMSALMKGQLDNGFMPQTIITVVGDVLEKALSEDGSIKNTNSTDSIAQTIKDALGATSGGGVAMITSPDPNAKINIQFVDSTKFTENAATISKLLNEGVCRIFGVPPILAGISEAGKLGSSQQLALEVKAFNNDLQPYKQLLTNSILEVYGSEVKLEPLEPIAFIDPILAEVLTEEEKRKIFGFEPRDYAKVTV